jgi:molybdate-binding protein/DNA-binding XRE family transcriptional regulator
MSEAKSFANPVARCRAARGWSQAELARRAGIPRTTVSAIEGEKLTPSVTAALSLSQVLECSVEELFSARPGELVAAGPEWSWPAHSEPIRYWEAEVGGRRWLYPVEGPAQNVFPHDGVWQGGIERDSGTGTVEKTLVLACCDPAAGLLAAEYARASGFRLLVIERGGGAALELLKKGLVHLAGLHRSTPDHPTRNIETVREKLGNDYRLLRVANWQEGLALPPGNRPCSLRKIVHQCRSWALREPGSAARECLDELLAGQSASGKPVHSHVAVAEAVRAGWAGAGVCVQLTAEEAGLNFTPIRTEMFDICCSDSLARDARILALIRLLRSRSQRRLIGELPGYDASETGEIMEVRI